MDLWDDHIEGMKKIYKTNHLFIPMGGDFEYSNAHMNFANTDRLIKNVNKLRPDQEVFYSTPSVYIKAINEAFHQWPINYSDMMPYAERADSYWTGYYTSRANDKALMRLGS